MEPERKIEKLLRAFAKKRRDDAGDFKLHPATRRLLQGEVARRTPKSNEESFLARLFGTLRPGLIYAACFGVVVFMGAALLLPSLNKAKNRSQMAGAASNLKQIGVAAKEFADENKQQLPQSLGEIQRVTDTNLLVDPVSGKPFVYVAGGRSVDSLRPDSVLAYSPEDDRNRAVLFADGHVESVSRTRFAEITNRGLIQLALGPLPARRKLLAEAPAPRGSPTLSGGIGGAGGAGGELKIADLPAAGKILSGTDFEKSKIEAINGDQKKSPAEIPISNTGALFDSGLARNDAASQTKALSPPATVATTASEAITSPARDRVPAQTDTFATKNTATVTQAFSQIGNKQSAQNLFKNAAASLKMTPVLANFQFQQNGSEVAVVDEDGSVYNGYLVAPSEGAMQNEPTKLKQPTTKALPSPKLAKDSADKIAETSQNFYFRVAGTNRSLQQNVVFTGNVLTFSNAAQASSQTINSSFYRFGSGGGNMSPALNNNASQQLGVLSNSRIAGTAVVNNTNEIQIEALPVGP